MFDIFYSGQHKLNLFPHEQPADSVEDARAKSRTKFFWFVEQYGRKTDLRLFNWKWLPTPWEEQQTHLIPVYSQFENCLIHFCPTHQDEEVHHHYKAKFLKRNTVKEYWHVLKNEAKWEVNPEWVPNPYEPPYIYVLGNPWYSAEEMPTLEYRVPGATEYKYINEPVVTCKADPHCWVILKPEYNWKIDPSWAPNPFEPPYIYCFGNSWFAPEEVVAEYRVDGATEYKYLDEEVVTIVAKAGNWKILKPEYNWKIDPNWAPNPFEPPYIYVFGNPWYTSVEMPTAEYHVDGATEYKYCDEQVVAVKIESTNWKILKTEAKWLIDMTWAPNPFESPYIYVFGNPWYSAVEMPTAEYHVPGATERKYCDDKVLTLTTDKTKWKFLKTEAEWRIDPNWAPNPFEPPYIYVFGNPWYSAEEMPTAEYYVPGATEYKYVEGTIVTVKPNTKLSQWKKLRDEAEWDIDLTWMPNPFEEPFIYVFGNDWYSAEEMPTAEYHVPGATERKYCDDKVVNVKLSNHWKALLPNVSLDSIGVWQYNPFEPPFIYVFGNQWYPAEIMPTVEYHVPGATERKYVADVVATLVPTRLNWFVPEEINAGAIDFSWIPHPKEQPYIYHFSSEFQMSTGLTYTVPGATDPKFETDVPVLKRRIGARLNSYNKEQAAEAKTITQTVSMFFVDMSNKTSASRYESLKLRYPDIQKIRFMNGWVETIKRCLTRSETQKFWVISSENVYDDFNFEWHAQPWQNYMTHIFASQWQKWSDTFLINKKEFERHIKWAKTLEEFPNLNFVKDQPVYRPDDIYDIYYVDHFNPGSKENYERIAKRYPDIKSARYVDNYLDTLKRVIGAAETDYIWVTNSICDYAKFDFTWQPEPWQAKMLHVFPAGSQKFGDTFYVHVPSFKEQMDKLELLDWFDTVNYCTEQQVPRLGTDVITFESDSVVDAIKEHSFTGPFAWFRHVSIKDVKIPDYSPSIWRKKDRVVHVFAANGSLIAVPREAKAMLDTQVYDYPYILPHKEMFVESKDSDVVYISNGEPMADKHWEILKAQCPRAKRSDGVLGREKAYKAAAMLSDTPWFFAVFAKTEVLPTFDFKFQPDYLQEPKHYIFHSRNALNGLEYGAMNINLYNKQLVLDTQPGLDFTLSKAHEVVPICASISRFNTDPWITWRSAFREVMKLKLEVDNGAVPEIKHRMDVWLSKAEGENAEYCLQGSNDSMDYYISVNGDLDKLQLSFDWAWCEDYYFKKYGKKIWL